MKAINVILARDRLDRERKKKEESKRARIEMEVPHEGAGSTFVPLAPSQGAPGPLNTNMAPVSMVEHARHMQIYKAETASRGSPISVAVGTPREASQSPIGPGQGSSMGGENSSHFAALNVGSGHTSQVQSVVDGVWNRLAEAGINGTRDGGMASSWGGINTGTHPVEPRRGSSQAGSAVTKDAGAGIRQLGAEISQLVSDLTSQAATTNGQNGIPAVPVPYPGLDVETLHALRDYIYQETTEVEWDEDGLLSRLESTWREGVRSDYDRMVLDIPAFIARERAFLTWIELKRHLADLQRAGTRTYPIITLARSELTSTLCWVR